MTFHNIEIKNRRGRNHYQMKIRFSREQKVNWLRQVSKYQSLKKIGISDIDIIIRNSWCEVESERIDSRINSPSSDSIQKYRHSQIWRLISNMSVLLLIFIRILINRVKFLSNYSIIWDNENYADLYVLKMKRVGKVAIGEWLNVALLDLT